MKTKLIKARKSKPCICCLGLIEKGELYDKEVAKHKGGYNGMIDEWEDGYNETIFYHSDKDMCSEKSKKINSDINDYER